MIPYIHIYTRAYKQFQLIGYYELPLIPPKNRKEKKRQLVWNSVLIFLYG